MPEAVRGPRGLPDPRGSRSPTSFHLGALTDIGASLGASEREEFVRAAFRVMVMSSIDSERLVFVDECSTNTSLAPLYGWARRGERVHHKVPRNWDKNVTLLSSIGKRMGMGASVVVEGSTNTKVCSRPTCARSCVPRWRRARWW